MSVPLSVGDRCTRTRVPDQESRPDEAPAHERGGRGAHARGRHGCRSESLPSQRRGHETHHVLAAPEEMRYPNVNRAALEQLADATGGEMIELTDPAWAKRIAGQLKGEAKLVRRPPDDRSLWDNWMVLTVLVAVYSLDVALRRFGGLS